MNLLPRRFSRLDVALLTLLSLLATPLFADVTLPAIFSDHMVMQQDVLVPIWGWAAPGEEITITIAGQSTNAKADDKGRWSGKIYGLKPLVEGSATLIVKGQNTLTINDVLIGEVWLCSGQSNMGFKVNRADNFEAEKAAALYPQIRTFTVTFSAPGEPQEKYKGVWTICSPETVGSFSATAYFFGREIHKKTGHAVGLINSSVGGTPIEAWTSMDVQKLLPELQPVLDSWTKKQANYSPEKAKEVYEKQLAKFNEDEAKAKAEGKPLPRKPQLAGEPIHGSTYPANLFNGMINPLIPFAIRGAIWYQGESNADNALAQYYGLQLHTMITDWRHRWGYEFPVGIVQLPDFHAAQKDPSEFTAWVVIREGMLRTLSTTRKTGMAVTLGCGMANDVHPTNKQEVGRRLSCWALNEVYGLKEVAPSGPMPAGITVNGSEATLHFAHADGGLVAKDGDLKGFAIAGEDKIFHFANAKIAGDNVIVSSPDVTKPVAVRYAWAPNPQFNLFNGAGLPATPFRTDDWK